MIYIGVPTYSYEACLTHHGILGQKWGIRRYQNKDGTLTDAGKRRLAKLEAREAKYARKRRQLTGEQDKKSQKIQNGPDEQRKQEYQPSNKNPHGKKSVFSMSDDELKREIERLDLEKRYKSYMNELYPTKTPEKKESRLAAAGRSAFRDVLSPALKEVGKQAATNIIGYNVNKIGKSLGINTPLYKQKVDDKKKDDFNNKQQTTKLKSKTASQNDDLQEKIRNLQLTSQYNDIIAKQKAQAEARRKEEIEAAQRAAWERQIAKAEKKAAKKARKQNR